MEKKLTYLIEHNRKIYKFSTLQKAQKFLTTENMVMARFFVSQEIDSLTDEIIFDVEIHL